MLGEFAENVPRQIAESILKDEHEQKEHEQIKQTEHEQIQQTENKSPHKNSRTWICIMCCYIIFLNIFGL